MLKSAAKSFLRQCPAFAQIDDHALTQLTKSLVLQIYPAGTSIVRQGDISSALLHIIKDGTVRISTQTLRGEENIIDYRGKFDTFGSYPSEDEQPLRFSVQAVTDTVCYVADRASVAKLLDAHPALRDYLVSWYSRTGDDRSSRSPSAVGGIRDRSESALFTTSVGELAAHEVVTVDATVSIERAVQTMFDRRASALVIVDTVGRPVGMLTDTDLRDRVLHPRKNVLDPISDVMSTPLAMIDGSALCFEALLKMMSGGIHHLLVMDGGNVTGIISDRDFLVLQVATPLMILRDIEKHSSLEELASSSGKIAALITALLRDGTRAISVNRIITTVNDRIEQMILDLAMKTLGPPPLSFCWIVYGSAGRMEQTFMTDQDNGLIYADPPNDEKAREAHTYFSRYAAFAVRALQRCGFKLCPGEFMATNPKWCQPLSIWKNYFCNWSDTSSEKTSHYSAIVFDFRGLHGNLQLADDLKTARAFTPRDLKAVAELTVDSRPLLGPFGSLMVERDGVHANSLNFKKSCLTPLINILRLFSFECGIQATSTAERLALLKMAHPAMRTLGDDLEYGLEFLSMIRIRHQLEQVRAGLAPDNFINPKQLSSLEQRNVKEICRLLSRILDDIEKKYGVETQR